MGREVRRVPKGWKHPTNASGNFIPLLDGDYKEVFEEWKEHFTLWEQDIVSINGEERPRRKSDGNTFEEWYGRKPMPHKYMNHWFFGEEPTFFMMYENITEGTPISPAFETPEALAHWLADNRADAFCGEPATYEQWLRIAKGGYAPTMVMTIDKEGNTTIQGGIQAALE